MPKSDFSVLAGVMLLLAAVWVQALVAEDQPVTSPILTLDDIYKSDRFDSKSCDLQWEDDETYTQLESSEIKDGHDIVRYQVDSGERTIVVNAKDLIPAGAEKPLDIQSYQWSSDQRKVLIFTNTRRVWRRNTRGDYWVWDSQAGTLKKMGERFPEASLQFAKFSPDGETVAYVQANRIYTQSLSDQQIQPLTDNDSADIIQGTFDWVYEEEFGLRDGYDWSPDGRKIAFWQLDTTGVPQFTLINNTAELYPTTQVFGYPKVGQQNPAASIGVVEVSTRAMQLIALPGDPRENYIARMEWTEDSQRLLLQQLNRLQNRLTLWSTSLADHKHPQQIFADEDAAWIDMDDDFTMLDPQQFLWSSDHDGWNRLYRIRFADGQMTPITPAQMDMIEFLQFDKTSQQVYFMASPDNATQRYLYRCNLDGSALIRLTPDEQPGMHSYDVSPKAKFALHGYSQFQTPPQYELIRMQDHQSLKVLEDNRQLRDQLKSVRLGSTKFLKVDIGDQVVLDAWQILPPDFDPQKKYPLLVYVYGEPAGQTVLDRWGGSGYLWHQMLAQQGYVIMSFDNRGTPAPRGRNWRKEVYRQIGILGPRDQSEAVKQVLAAYSYLDAQRVGIWGWSGGGSSSLHAIFKYPNLYKMAIAIAAVPNQLYYDTIYQERYMGLPQDNAEGFKQGSPITHAKSLKGNLLLVHGTGDDNCHYQTVELLINELISEDKQFTLMVYPNRSHSISEGANTTRHLRRLMTEFIQQNL
jgi:dipeptidyl-peptidase-4